MDSITLTPGSVAQATATPTSPGVKPGPNGCSLLNVTCTAQPNGQVFMQAMLLLRISLNFHIFQFNSVEGGPLNPIGSQVDATLNCNSDAKWVYVGGGITRVITEVNCVLT